MRQFAIQISIISLLMAPSLVVAMPTLLFSEILYDTPGSDTGKEWVELYNYGDAPVAVVTGTATTSFRFSDGARHVLTLVQGTSDVQPHGFAIIAADAAGWLADHTGFQGTLFDSAFSLQNTSSTIALSINTTEPLFAETSYENVWGGAGDGHTLERAELSDTATWRASLASGTPGFWKVFSEEPINVAPTATPPVVAPAPISQAPASQIVFIPQQRWSSDILINELLPNPAGSDTEHEWIELYNSGSVPVNISGWKLQDNSSTVYTITEEDFASVDISPGGLLVVSRKASGIALNNSGADAVKLYWPDGVLAQAIMYEGPAGEEQSWSRFDDGWRWTESTQAAPNIFTIEPTATEEREAPQTVTAAIRPALSEGTLIVTEIMPNPDGPDTDEWIEIKNVSTSTVDLTGVSLDDADGGSKPYLFQSQIIEPGAYVIMPKSQTGLSLNNTGDRVRLQDRGSVLDEVSYESAKSGSAYAYDEMSDEWIWTAAWSAGHAYEPVLDTSETLTQERLPSDETRVLVQGVVIMPPGVITKRSMYVLGADDTVIELYQNKGLFPTVSVGDRIEALGMPSETEAARVNLAEAASLVIVGTTALQAPTLDVVEVSEEYDRRWVTLVGTLSRIGKSSYTMTSDEIRLLVYPKFAGKQAFEKGSSVSATGFLYYRGGKPHLYVFRTIDIEIADTPAVEGFSTEAVTAVPDHDASERPWYYLATVPVAAFVGWLFKRFAR